MKHDLMDKLSVEQDGFLTTGDVTRAGVSKTWFLNYVRKNNYERIGHGMYLAPDSLADGFYALQKRHPSVIFSHETALYLHNLSDREPLAYNVTVKHGYNPTALKASGIDVYTVTADRFEIGVTECNTPFGHSVKSYDMERTICDLLRPRSRVEAQDYTTALKEYFRRKDRDIPKLMDYGKLFKVEKKLRLYTEVLL